MTAEENLTFCGETKTIREWSCLTGLCSKEILAQINQGVDPKIILTNNLDKEGIKKLAEIIKCNTNKVMQGEAVMADEENKEEVEEVVETAPAGVSAPVDEFEDEFEDEETLEEAQAADAATEEEAAAPVVAKASTTPAGAPEGSVPATEKKPGRRGRKSQNSKDAIVVQTVSTQLDGEDVTLVRKKSSQIKAFKGSEDAILAACTDVDGEPNLTGAAEEALEELTAKPTLRKVNETNNLGISEEGHNTRQFGKKVMDALEAKQAPAAPAKAEATETTEA